MKWYYKIMGGHTHVRVFMNGGKCGDLCFRNEEFDFLRNVILHPSLTFIKEEDAAVPLAVAQALIEKHPTAEFKENE